MSHVEFKKWQCPLFIFMHYPCQFKNSLMSHVKFKKWPNIKVMIILVCRIVHESCQFLLIILDVLALWLLWKMCVLSYGMGYPDWELISLTRS